MDKFTEGNWQAHGSDKSRRITVKSGKKLICSINPSDEDWNNANLISASKDMLEALESARIRIRALADKHSDASAYADMNKINFAINKAKGKL